MSSPRHRAIGPRWWPMSGLSHAPFDCSATYGTVTPRGTSPKWLLKATRSGHERLPWNALGLQGRSGTAFPRVTTA